MFLGFCLFGNLVIIMHSRKISAIAAEFSVVVLIENFVDMAVVMLVSGLIFDGLDMLPHNH